MRRFLRYTVVLALFCSGIVLAYHAGRIDMDNRWIEKDLRQICELEYGK